MRAFVVMGLVGMMSASAWASDLTVEVVADLYAGLPAGFEVTGLAPGEKVRVAVVEDDGDVVTFGMAEANAAGAVTLYGMLPDNEDSVLVAAQSLGGSQGTATFPIGTLVDRNCFQSGYCATIDVIWTTGMPNALIGPATQAECQAVPDSADWWAWDEGYRVAGNVNGISLTLLAEVCQ